MDPKLFRLPTKPNFLGGKSGPPINIRDIARNQTVPAPNSRFPGYPAQMEDGRLVTDYEPHCANNVPSGQQIPTTLFMQRNGEEIIGLSRRLSAKRMGMDFMLDPSVVPPLAQIVSCTKSECKRTPNYGSKEDGANPFGGAPIGSGRRETVPELFGTFSIPYSSPPPSNTGYTTRYEGGRNSLRGSRPYDIVPGPIIGDGLSA